VSLHKPLYEHLLDLKPRDTILAARLMQASLNLDTPAYKKVMWEMEQQIPHDPHVLARVLMATANAAGDYIRELRGVKVGSDMLTLTISEHELKEFLTPKDPK